MDKVKLVVPEPEVRNFPSLRNLKLNLNGHRPRGKNLYKRRLNQIRRLLR